MRKIGVITDVHGNLQALTAALEYLKLQHCEEIIHTGDVICIGPNSRECLELLLENNVVCLMGNHDLDFAQNNYIHKYMSHVATEHKQFVFASVEDYRTQIEAFPLFCERICGGKKVVFEHYCRPQNGYVSLNGEPFLQLKPYPYQPDVAELDNDYRNYDCDVIFYGHQHKPSDFVGKRVYVDTGSLSCHPEPLATGIVICFDETHFSYQRFAVPYNKDLTEQLMVNGNLPDGEYLYRRYYMRDSNFASKFLRD